MALHKRSTTAQYTKIYHIPCYVMICLRGGRRSVLLRTEADISKTLN